MHFTVDQISGLADTSVYYVAASVLCLVQVQMANSGVVFRSGRNWIYLNDCCCSLWSRSEWSCERV